MSNNILPVTIAKMLDLKGQFTRVVFERPVKVKKGSPSFTKRTEMTVRLGVEYDNQAAVQEKREEGELPSENAGLNGVEWVVYPYILRSLKSGELQVRVTPVINDACKPKVEFRDAVGEVVDREVVKSVAYASEFAERGEVHAFNLTASRIVSVNGEAA